MNKRFVLQILFAVILASCMTSNAKTWISDDAGVSFQIPDDSAWSQATPPNPQVKLLLERAGKSAEIFFAVITAPPNQQVLNQDFITGFEKGYWPQGKSVKRTGEFSNFKGKKVYKTSGEMFIKDVVFKKALIVWIENGKVFMISMMKKGADPYEDADIKKFLELTKFNSKSVK
ncbi:MAG: hypothetical protein WDM80_12055 [Limisphaerales bacterium]